MENIMGKVNDMIDIVPESEKDVFKADTVSKEEMKINIDDKIDTVINNTLDRKFNRTINRKVR